MDYLPGAEGFTKFLSRRVGKPLEVLLVNETEAEYCRSAGRLYSVNAKGSLLGTYSEFDRFPNEKDFDRYFEGEIPNYRGSSNYNENPTFSDFIVLSWEAKRHIFRDSEGILRITQITGFNREDNHFTIPFPNLSIDDIKIINSYLNIVTQKTLLKNRVKGQEYSHLKIIYPENSLNKYAKEEFIKKLRKLRKTPITEKIILAPHKNGETNLEVTLY